MLKVAVPISLGEFLEKEKSPVEAPVAGVALTA
jgi:hypothetical protein